MKVISFNIKQIGYYNTYNSTKNKKISELLTEQNADIICLQETEEEQVKQYVQFLNSKTGDNYDYVYDVHNAIITRLKINDKLVKKIKKEATYYDRGIIKLTLDYNDIPVIVVATHLDHLSEMVRLKQIEDIQSELHKADILVGDLNSLRFEDYTSDYLYAVEMVRKDNRIETVQNNVINTIESLGFKTTPFKSATCPYGTRIDYIYIKSNFINKHIDWIDDRVIDCIKPDLTDHNMVINHIYFKKSMVKPLLDKLCENIKNLGITKKENN